MLNVCIECCKLSVEKEKSLYPAKYIVNVVHMGGCVIRI